MKQDPRTVDAFNAAKAHRGVTKEIVGPQHNQQIVDFFKAVGHGWIKDDETAWCAAFVGAMLSEAGLEGTGKLNARSYLDWGEPIDLNEAKPGDIVVFWRVNPNSWQGHVGFYVNHGATVVSVLGGNQDNEVNIKPYKKDVLLGVRRLRATSMQEESVTKPASSLIQVLTNLIRRLLK